MGRQVTLDNCLQPTGTFVNGIEVFVDTCKTKTVYLNGGTGIGGPKFRPAVLTGPDELVDQLMDIITKAFREKS